MQTASVKKDQFTLERKRKGERKGGKEREREREKGEVGRRREAHGCWSKLGASAHCIFPALAKKRRIVTEETRGKSGFMKK